MPRKTTRSVQRAKILEPAQFDRALAKARNDIPSQANRTEVILRLSFHAGLRAKEIAGLRWKVNVLDSAGRIPKTLHITGDIGKRTVEREVPLTPELQKALKALYAEKRGGEHVIYPLKPREFGKSVGVSSNTLRKWLERFYGELGFVGCSSHSGRRTFITRAARKVNLVGASLVDVQHLAGHKRLETTGAYIELSKSQRSLVNIASV